MQNSWSGLKVRTFDFFLWAKRNFDQFFVNIKKKWRSTNVVKLYVTFRDAMSNQKAEKQNRKSTSTKGWPCPSESATDQFLHIWRDCLIGLHNQKIKHRAAKNHSKKFYCAGTWFLWTKWVKFHSAVFVSNWGTFSRFYFPRWDRRSSAGSTFDSGSSICDVTQPQLKHFETGPRTPVTTSWRNAYSPYEAQLVRRWNGPGKFHSTWSPQYNNQELDAMWVGEQSVSL